MEMQGAAAAGAANRLSESALTRGLLSTSVASCSSDSATPNCSGAVEDVCACSNLSLRLRGCAIGSPSGTSQSIISGRPSLLSSSFQQAPSDPKNRVSKRSRYGNSYGGQGNEAFQIFSLSLFSISIGFVFPEASKAAGGWFGGTFGNGGQDNAVAKIKPATITLAVFTVARYAYEKITELFAKKWLEETGQKVYFRLSLAPSGSQARAVIDGLPADVVFLALPLDVIKIQEAGLIDEDWQKRVPNNAVAAETTVCLVTRTGNPKNIIDWADLTRSGVTFVTGNPKSAGVARWNFLALWGSIVVVGGTEDVATTFLEDALRNVPVLPRDAREVSDVFFNQKIGDAMLTYENEILWANEKIIKNGGAALPFLVPKLNVRVETSLAVVDQNARKAGVHEICTAFVDFCFTEPAQKEYAKSGFRPFLESVGKDFGFPKIENHWRVEEEIGGWNFVQKKFFADKALVDVIEGRIRSTRVSI